MSEKKQAFFWHDNYYLLPDGLSSVEELLSSVDGKKPIEVRRLTENNYIASYTIEKGVCIAPYFYSEYGYEASEITIEDASDVFPVEVELFTQAEYNDRLREVVLNYCPGCLGYKPLSPRVQSLNGHFEEISLNSVCFYRQISKPSPRNFRWGMFSIGGSWKHHAPTECKTDLLLDHF